MNLIIYNIHFNLIYYSLYYNNTLLISCTTCLAYVDYPTNMESWTDKMTSSQSTITIELEAPTLTSLDDVTDYYRYRIYLYEPTTLNTAEMIPVNQADFAPGHIKHSFTCLTPDTTYRVRLCVVRQLPTGDVEESRGHSGYHDVTTKSGTSCMVAYGQIHIHL